MLPCQQCSVALVGIRLLLYDVPDDVPEAPAASMVEAGKIVKGEATCQLQLTGSSPVFQTFTQRRAVPATVTLPKATLSVTCRAVDCNTTCPTIH